jgi:hypothetical protein
MPVYDVRENPKLAGTVRVLVNGRDVSRECYRADTDRGEVYLFKRRRGGGFYVEHGRVARTVDRGLVTVEAR